MFFKPSKKAQGLSLNVIILVVLGIAVLVVLIFIFVGKTKIFGQTSSSCEARGAGAGCIESGGACDGVIYRFGTDCGKRNADEPHCCVPLGS